MTGLLFDNVVMWQFDNYLLFGLVLISARPQLLNFTPSPFLSFFLTFNAEAIGVGFAGGNCREHLDIQEHNYS